MDVKNLSSLELSLFELKLWGKIGDYFSIQEKSALTRFEERFGQQALRTRALNELAKRTQGTIDSTIKALIAEARVEAQQLRDKVFLKPTIFSQSQKSADQKHLQFNRQFSRLSQSLLQSLITQRLWIEVIERNFSPKELTSWTEKLSHKNHQQELDKFKSEIARRVGMSLEQLVKQVQEDVVSRSAQMITETVEEVRSQNLHKKSKQIVLALKEGDVKKLVNDFKL